MLPPSSLCSALNSLYLLPSASSTTLDERKRQRRPRGGESSELNRVPRRRSGGAATSGASDRGRRGWVAVWRSEVISSAPRFAGSPICSCLASQGGSALAPLSRLVFAAKMCVHVLLRC